MIGLEHVDEFHFLAAVVFALEKELGFVTTFDDAHGNVAVCKRVLQAFELVGEKLNHVVRNVRLAFIV